MATLFSFARLLNTVATNCLRRNDLLSSPCKQILTVPKPWVDRALGIRTRTLPWLKVHNEEPSEICKWNAENEKLASDITNEINNQIATDTTGRFFAIVQICGKQFKITESDLIIVEGYWPPNPGDQLKLEKVLLIGSTDFTLVGRPILNRELVSIDATVIDKTLSHTKVHFKYKKREQYRRINFYRAQYTMLRINSIRINGNIDEKKEVEGLDRVY